MLLGVWWWLLWLCVSDVSAPLVFTAVDVLPVKRLSLKIEAAVYAMSVILSLRSRMEHRPTMMENKSKSDFMRTVRRRFPLYILESDIVTLLSELTWDVLHRARLYRE
jgi:hypothetical protein